MRKNLLILLAMILCLGIFLCACDKKEATPDAIPQYKVTVTCTDDCTVQPLNETYAQGETLILVVSPASYDVIPLAKVNGQAVDLCMPVPEDTVFATTLEDAKIVEYTGDWSCDITVTENLQIEVSSVALADRVESASANRETVLATATEFVNNYYYYGEDVASSNTTHSTDTTHGTYAVGYYRGLPYGTGITSLSAFQTVVTETGTATLSKYSDGRNPQEVTIHNLDTDEFVNRWIWLYGGSCADLALWSWSTVSENIGFLTAFALTPYMGAYKVGNYEATYVGQRGSVDGNVVAYADTVADCEKNGLSVMAEAYAQLQPGDALTTHQVGGASHVILVTEVHITRNRDGSVSPNGSWIRYHDTHGQYTPIKEWITVDGEQYQVMSCTKVDEMMNFERLFAQGYLPVTCRELLTGQAPVEASTVTDSETSLSKATVTSGTVSSNYKIDYLTMTIQKGDTVEQEAIRYGIADTYDLSYFACWDAVVETGEAFELYGEDNVIDLSKLSGGTYRCILTVHLGNGDSITVRDFQFTN